MEYPGPGRWDNRAVTQILEVLADSFGRSPIRDEMGRHQSCGKPESQSLRANAWRWFQMNYRSDP